MLRIRGRAPRARRRKILRSLSDFKGDELISRVLDLVEKYKPMHLSIVGGDPLVRYRELEVLLPQLVKLTKVQVVTSAFRPIPVEWATLPNLQISVSIDGLQPEHDVRRAPATYERILRNIEGQHATVHCTITSAMVKRDRYIDEFVDFWSANANVEKIWMSIFTPQRGAKDPEILSVDERRRVVEILLRLRESRPKLDMPALVIREFLRPPESPERCVFAQTTRSISADFKTPVVPCQFGGDPDCSQCGCLASMGLAAVGKSQTCWADDARRHHAHVTGHRRIRAARRKMVSRADGIRSRVVKWRRISRCGWIEGFAESFAVRG